MRLLQLLQKLRGDSMNEKEMLKNLIDNPKKPNASEWLYKVEAFLENINESDTEVRTLIDGNIKQYDAYNCFKNLVALLKQLYKHKYDGITLLPMQFNGSIIEEITTEITDSLALIADQTGNRGCVYYEAGVTRELQLCNHPIKLIFTCSRSFFDNTKVHFDVHGDNILLYSDGNDLKNKFTVRLQSVFQEETKS